MSWETFAIGFLVGFVVCDIPWRWLSASMMKLVHEQRDLVTEQGDLIDNMKRYIVTEPTGTPFRLAGQEDTHP